MQKSLVDAVVLAAGKGTRMVSESPKVLHPIDGMPLVQHVLENIKLPSIKRKIVVVGFKAKKVRKFLSSYDSLIDNVLQSQQLGTGHAVLCAEKKVKSKHVLVLAGDVPFIQSQTISKLIKKHIQSKSAASILSARVINPKGYGRIVRDSKNKVLGIREELDASAKERLVKEVNTGFYIFDSKVLFSTLKKIKTKNKKKEYYLTDVIALLSLKSKKVESHPISTEEEMMGINSKVDLMKAQKLMNQKTLKRLMEKGVVIVSPENTFIANDVKIGRDTVILPFTYIGKKVVIGKRCQIGPFSHIREEVKIDDGSQVGSFVEVVRSKVGKNSMVKHLTYLGDSVVGNKANLGAGTITANYDGKNKSKTIIGDGAFIGSNTVLVAPVKIGNKAKTGAGSVVLAKANVPKGTTVAGVPAKKIK